MIEPNYILLHGYYVDCKFLDDPGHKPTFMFLKRDLDFTSGKDLSTLYLMQGLAYYGFGVRLAMKTNSGLMQKDYLDVVNCNQRPTFIVAEDVSQLNDLVQIGKEFNAKKILFGRRSFQQEADNEINEQLLDYIDEVFVTSDYVKNNWTQLSSSHEIKVLHNCLSKTSITSPITNRREGICYVGRIARTKGITHLVNAMRNIHDTLHVYGDTNNPLARKLIDSKPENVIFHGVKKPGNIFPEVYLKHKLTVIPSLWNEPFGRPAIEAMACGCRVLATRKGGLTEILPPEYLFDFTGTFSLQKAILVAKDLMPTVSYSDVRSRYDYGKHAKDFCLKIGFSNDFFRRNPGPMSETIPTTVNIPGASMNSSFANIGLSSSGNEYIRRNEEVQERYNRTIQEMIELSLRLAGVERDRLYHSPLHD